MLAKKETKLKACLLFASLAEFAILTLAINQADAAYDDAKSLDETISEKSKKEIEM